MLWADQLLYDNAMQSYWDTQLFDPNTLKSGAEPSLVQGSIFTATWSRTHAAAVTEDWAAWSVHFVMRPGGAGITDNLSDSDCSAVEDSFMTNWWGPMVTLTSSQWQLAQMQWRDFGADFPLDKNGFSKPGPLRRALNILGSGTASGARIADQVAATVTYKTASRKHWGRSYVGGLTTTPFTTATFGHFSQAYVDALAGAYHAWFNHVYGLSRIIEPVVWSPKYRGLLSIDELVVDDVPDIIRSRRAKAATYRKTFTS